MVFEKSADLPIATFADHQVLLKRAFVQRAELSTQVVFE
jgi:hypothetical protein